MTKKKVAVKKVAEDVKFDGTTLLKLLKAVKASCAAAGRTWDCPLRKLLAGELE